MKLTPCIARQPTPAFGDTQSPARAGATKATAHAPRGGWRHEGASTGSTGCNVSNQLAGIKGKSAPTRTAAGDRKSVEFLFNLKTGQAVQSWTQPLRTRPVNMASLAHIELWPLPLLVYIYLLGKQFTCTTKVA